MRQQLETPFHALRIAYGIVPVVAGADKFTNLLTDWKQYLSPLAVKLLPVSPDLFMRAVGVVEIVVGILVLTSATTRLGAWLACGWLAAIAVNLLTGGRFLDVAARDAVMSVGAFALARLATVRATERQLRSLYPERSIAQAPPTAATASAASTPRPVTG